MTKPLDRAVKRGDCVTVVRSKHDVWIKRTPEDIQALRDADAKAGRWHDDGGEPILYGPFKSWPKDVYQMTLIVTSRRPPWCAGYRQRPRGLRAGWSKELGCEVLFQSL